MSTTHYSRTNENIECPEAIEKLKGSHSYEWE